MIYQVPAYDNVNFDIKIIGSGDVIAPDYNNVNFDIAYEDGMPTDYIRYSDNARKRNNIIMLTFQ